MRMRTRAIWPMIVVMALLFAGVLVVDAFKRYLNRKNPVTSVEAEVADRRRETHSGRYGVTGHSYYVSFRPIGGGETQEFQVGEAEYNAYKWGDRGTLSHRTWEFISFKPENRRTGAEDVPVGFADEEEKE